MFANKLVLMEKKRISLQFRQHDGITCAKNGNYLQAQDMKPSPASHINYRF